MTTTATIASTLRPEDRRRSDSAGWADSVPAYFRSEAFAEDLDGSAEAPSRAVSVAAPPRVAAWRLWSGLAVR